jgi:cytochrome c oxidase subunit 2
MLEGFDRDASTFAADVDRAFWITTGISAAMFALVAGLMLFFIFRYHHSRVKPDEIGNIKDHLGLEIAWTVIPTMLLLVIFYYGYSAFREVRTLPEDAFTVDVLGKRWSWTFIYPNGKRTAELYVPVGENIRLRLHAPENDVIHSFYVPAFRVKEDVVPGRNNHLWFKATAAGRYDVECAEYCGTRHSYMRSKVEVMEKAAFDAWYAGDKLSPHDTGAPRDAGEALYKTLGCSACHSLDGSVIAGPSFKGIFGKKVRVMTRGKPRELVVDEAYLRHSIESPDADVVAGFPEGVMPDFSGHISEEQIEAIIAFIKKQRAPASEAVLQPAPEAAKAEKTGAGTPPKTKPQAGPVDGATLFKTKGCVACHSLDGSKKVGPSLKGLYQSTQTVVTGGKTRKVTADEAYLRRSIQDPNADVVEGFQPGIMPPFGKLLAPDEVEALVKYLKEVK